MPSLAVLNMKEKRRYEVPVTRQVVSIGRASDNDIVLDRPGVSKHHCKIIQRGTAYYLLNLSEQEPTQVDGKAVESLALLTDGARIAFGDFEITFKQNGAPVKSAFVPFPALRQGSAVATRHDEVERSSHSPSAPGALDERATQAPAPHLADTTGPARKIPKDLMKRIHQRLIEDMDLKHLDMSKYTSEEIRARTTKAAQRIVDSISAQIPSWLSRDVLVEEVVNEALGLGPLEDFLAEPEIDEIMVNGCDRIYVERKGKITLTNRQFTDNEHVLSVIRRILAPIGRRIDESSPMVDARLADGSRVNAIIPPVCLAGPTITIRKFAKTPFTVDDLIGFGSLSPAMAEFLKVCVRYRKNFLISGGTGSGKTTLLNVVSGFIPLDERIVTIEDAAELKLYQDHVIPLEAKPPNIEGEGEIPIRKLVINALRMRPDRIIVGECRAGEALDMLQAMNTGHEGSLTTVHANSPRDAIARLETMVLMAGTDLPSRAILQQIASAIHIIVHTARLVDGRRKIVSISTITGMEGSVITMQDIFLFEQTGFAHDGAVEGIFRATGAIPKFVHDLRKRGIVVDMEMFS